MDWACSPGAGVFVFAGQRASWRGALYVPCTYQKGSFFEDARHSVYHMDEGQSVSLTGSDQAIEQSGYFTDAEQCHSSLTLLSSMCRSLPGAVHSLMIV